MAFAPPACPSLPPAPPAMDASALTALGSDRGATFYLTALTYGQVLWQRGLAARAILSLDRALGADLTASEPVLQSWPLPYGALAWMLGRVPAGIFIGNPRVHYQHLADRMTEPRRDQRRWRAWACWHLTRIVRPQLPGDPRHRVIEPGPDEIAAGLEAHGLPGETDVWRTAVVGARGASVHGS